MKKEQRLLLFFHAFFRALCLFLDQHGGDEERGETRNHGNGLYRRPQWAGSKSLPVRRSRPQFRR